MSDTIPAYRSFILPTRLPNLANLSITTSSQATTPPGNRVKPVSVQKTTFRWRTVLERCDTQNE